MAKRSISLSAAFRDFLANEQAGSILLIVCTVASLVAANWAIGESYAAFWHGQVGPLTVELWINDLLMAVFFLLIGLELKRELLEGELASMKRALLPIFAAVGGMLVPAAIHFAFNHGTPTQSGIGIPMATDIAFALGAIMLLGSRVPASLKVFLVALAVIDDLGAIIVIAIFYTAELHLVYLAGAVAVLAFLGVLNRLKVMSLVPYLLFGFVAWYLMFRSGVHATIAGVLLAFTIPSANASPEGSSPSSFLEMVLHKPVAFLILPIFALANTGVIVESGWTGRLGHTNSLGIIAGLFIGKPIGITIASLLAVKTGICRLPLDLSWRHVFGAGILGGIGFTMSIFITNLAFSARADLITESKISILVASAAAAVCGIIWLKIFGQPTADDTDPETMDLDE
jgi:NhaA family Na+:H+ antiporter